MNNNSNNNDNNIDDILDILQKRKQQDIKNNNFSDDAPTRIDTQAVKPESVPEKKAPENQASLFDGDVKINDGPVTNKADISKPSNTNMQKDPSDATSDSVKEVKPENISGIVISSIPASVDKTASSANPEKPASPVSKPQSNPVSKPDSPPVKPQQAPSAKPAGNVTPQPAAPKQQPAPVSKPVSRPATPSPKPKVEPTRTASGATISLDDFDEVTKPPKLKKKKEKPSKADNKFYVPGYVKLIIYLLVVFGVSLFISFSIIFIGNDMFALTKQEKEITVNIKEGSTIKEVASTLHENGVIEYPGIYSLYARIRTKNQNDMSGKFISGEHTLNSDMHYDQILNLLTVPQIDTSIVRVTIPEGYTVYETLNLLEEKKVIDSEGKEQLISMLNKPEGLEYDFLPDADEGDTGKFYLLEGYLFPDTYDFYIGENISSVLSKFLTNFDNKFDETFYERCKDLGMTVDEVVTLASIIQAEGNNTADFYLISNVFHNRLKHPTVLGYSSPLLQSDATSLYAYQGSKKGIELSADELKGVDSPYNTYKNFGLTPGAICNPGHDAIHAALYPSEYIIETDEQGNSAQIPIAYYYFYTASSNGKTYFSRNLDEHNSYVAADKDNDIERLEYLNKIYN